MVAIKQQDSKHITSLLNGTIASIKNVVPLPIDLGAPALSTNAIQLEFGVLIGITGDVKGKMVLNGSKETFASIGEVMFGMPLEGEMLSSFSGELGNMIAGGVSSNIMDNELQTDITPPTVMHGQTSLTGHKKALHVPITIENTGSMSIYLLMD